MKKREIVSMFKTVTGAAFITRNQLKKLMGVKDPHCVDKYLRGLDRVNGKYYFIPDVAEALLERRT